MPENSMNEIDIIEGMKRELPRLRVRIVANGFHLYLSVLHKLRSVFSASSVHSKHSHAHNRTNGYICFKNSTTKNK